MSVKIISDSGCDMPKEEAERLGVGLIPLRTNLDGVEYLDGVTMTPEEFYRRMESGMKEFSTSQIPPHDFTQAIERALGSPEDEVIVLTISSTLSGTYQSACIAASEFDSRVYVVDGQSVAAGQRILVEYAIRLRDQGMDAAGIVKALEQAKLKVRLIARLDTLEYLVRGGRLSKAAGFAGTLMNIKPILGLVDGKIEMLGKARGAKQGASVLNQLIEKSGGIDDAMPVSLGYTGTSNHLLMEYIESNEAIWKGRFMELPVHVIGSSIGAHVGPGVVAVAFFAAK